MGLQDVLITGASGQDALITRKLLLSKGYKPRLLSRKIHCSPRGFDESYICLDPSKSSFVDQLTSLIQEIQPRSIYHYASANQSSEAPKDSASELYTANLFYTKALIDACLKYSRHTKLFIAGSIHQYTLPKAGIHEVNCVLQESPRNYYGLSKSACRIQANLARDLGLHVYFGVLFNHESALRHGDEYLITKLFGLCKRLVESKRNVVLNPSRIRKICLRKYHTHMDLSLARDICEAIIGIVEHNEPGNYLSLIHI